VPLVFGLYWKRATTQGAIMSVVLGLGTWLLFIAVPGWADAFPQQLAGLLAAITGMLAGSLMPQFMADHKGHVHHFEGSASA
jgi:SSS family solute:Na+ symporter